MSKWYEIKEVYLEDILKKVKMLCHTTESLGDIGGEGTMASGNMYEDEKELENTMKECGVGIVTKKQALRRKLELVELKGGGCEKCGYNKAPTALEFHHSESGGKSFNVSQATKNFNERQYREILIPHVINGTNLFCSNCHREFHWEKKKIKVNHK
jgi:hypothetical protein